MAALLSQPRELWVEIWCRLYLHIVEVTSWIIVFIYACLSLSSLTVLKQPFLVLQFCTQGNEITIVCVSGQDVGQT